MAGKLDMKSDVINNNKILISVHDNEIYVSEFYICPSQCFVHLIQRLFVLKTLNFLTDLKSSSCSLGTWATSSRRSCGFVCVIMMYFCHACCSSYVGYTFINKYCNIGCLLKDIQIGNYLSFVLDQSSSLDVSPSLVSHL